MTPDLLRAKVERLGEILTALSPVLVAYSGGVDSAFLLAKAIEVLGHDQVLAVFGLSASVGEDERAPPLELLDRLGARRRIVETHELDDPNYAANPFNRCYFCKSELFTRLE